MCQSDCDVYLRVTITLNNALADQIFESSIQDVVIQNLP